MNLLARISFFLFPFVTRESYRKILRHIPKGSVIDLGAGNGDMGVFLALRGYTVTAIDFYDEQLALANRFSKIFRLPFRGEHGDMHITPVAGYDVVVCDLSLHLAPADEARKTLDRIIAETSPGAYNFITEITTEQFELHKDSIGKIDPFLTPGLLKELYAGWEILEYEESRGAAMILARKPTGEAAM